MSSKAGSSWPVILHQSLLNTECSRLLRQRQLKVRESDSIVPGSCIFPLSNVAFLLVYLQQASMEWPPGSSILTPRQDLKESIHKFCEIHRRCYVLAVGSLQAEQDQPIFSSLQSEFLFTKLQFVPVCNISQAVNAMLDISKVLCKPTDKVMRQRLQSIVSRQLTDETILKIFQQVGLDEHQSLVVQDGIGSLAKLANATTQELLECSLDAQTVSSIAKFFQPGEQ